MYTYNIYIYTRHGAIHICVNTTYVYIPIHDMYKYNIYIHTRYAAQKATSNPASVEPVYRNTADFDPGSLKWVQM